MSDLLGHVDGADLYLITSLLIFLGVFILSIIYMVTISKSTIKTLSNLPFSDQPELETTVEDHSKSTLN
ncbi:MAG: hypothetical protein ACI8ZN_001944 [Bacteroidia bacterium]|jgi:hypothetical protein